MSEITSRPRVRSVVAANCAAAMGAGQEVLAGRALRSLVEHTDPVLAGQWCEASAAPCANLLSVPAALSAQLTAERDALTAAVGQVPPLTALKLSVLTGLEAAAYVGNSAEVQAPLQALLRAESLTVAEHARAELVRTLHASHVGSIVSTVARSCTESSKSLAFDRVTVDARPDGTTRIVATDAAGRALVSEVSVVGRDVQVETEVVGVRDGSCTALLDRWDAEMDARGVRGDRSRRSTGGLCQLNAARGFMERLVKPVVEPPAPAKPDPDARRRRLNSKPPTASRRG